MKLFYKRQLLTTLDITDASEYGFDTMQLKNMFSNSQVSDVEDDLVAPDRHFDPNMDFVLSMNLQGDPRCGPNSASGRRGSIDRDPWYDSSSSAFYTGWGSLFDVVNTRYGSRFKGLRWNHEYRPRLFKEGSKWVAYAEDNAASDYEDVQDNHMSRWHYWLDNIADTNARDAYKNEGRARQSPYNASNYDAVKRLYKHFVDFQVKAQARMVDLLANELGSSHTLIIYPAQEAGHNHTAAEYTINTHKVTASNAVREIATWDTHGYTNDVRNARAEEQGSRDYFFVIQQGNLSPVDPEDEDYITTRTNRMKGAVENCLDPGRGEDPWEDSFAFWNDWPRRDPNDDPEKRKITHDEQRQYIGRIKAALT